MGPEATMDISPCRELECQACCVGTAMTLTEADVRRLGARGHAGFWRQNARGDLQLVNRDGRCVFLTADGCSVYDHRPEGCRLYPLVLDVERDVVRHDPFCAVADRFPITREASAQLRGSVAAEEREAARRLAGRDPWEATADAASTRRSQVSR
jgi:Fe-S-cluster containining protein